MPPPDGRNSRVLPALYIGGSGITEKKNPNFRIFTDMEGF